MVVSGLPGAAVTRRLGYLTARGPALGRMAEAFLKCVGEVLRVPVEKLGWS